MLIAPCEYIVVCRIVYYSIYLLSLSASNAYNLTVGQIGGNYNHLYLSRVLLSKNGQVAYSHPALSFKKIMYMLGLIK